MATKGDIALATVAPLLPYLAGGLVLYFFGGKMLAALGAKVSGESVEEYKAQASTVGEALSHPLAATQDVLAAIQANVGGYISQDEQAAAIAALKAAHPEWGVSDKGIGTTQSLYAAIQANAGRTLTQDELNTAAKNWSSAHPGWRPVMEKMYSPRTGKMYNPQTGTWQ